MIVGTCPFCEWNARQDAAPADHELATAYVAKALMMHLRLKHARHDETRADNVAFSTILSARTKTGMVEFSLNDQMSQWDLDKARQIHRMLGEAIEAAVSDTLIYQFLVDKVGLADNAASAALLDFRELRQGSRDIITDGGN
jgi:hypothetical protein